MLRSYSARTVTFIFADVLDPLALSILVKEREAAEWYHF